MIAKISSVALALLSICGQVSSLEVTEVSVENTAMASILPISAVDTILNCNPETITVSATDQMMQNCEDILATTTITVSDLYGPGKPVENGGDGTVTITVQETIIETSTVTLGDYGCSTTELEFTTSDNLGTIFPTGSGGVTLTNSTDSYAYTSPTVSPITTIFVGGQPSTAVGIWKMSFILMGIFVMII